MLRHAVISVSFVLAAGLAHSSLRPLPDPLRVLSDEVGVLSVEEALKLASALEGIFDEDGIRVVLVIAETIQPEPIEDYVERLSLRWALDRGIDQTRAIFMIMVIGDRELVVMPAKALGLESALAGPDISEDLPPLFRNRRYYDALMRLTDRVHGVIHQHRGVNKPSTQ